MRSEETDKSPKGTVSTPIIPLLDVLNYFTASFCSGRISILSQPTHKKSKKKASGDPDSVLDLIFRADPTHLRDEQNDLVFRFEPLIIAVEFKDVASAHSLVFKAIACGFRESGITNSNKRVIIAIRCSIRLEVPLVSREIMVSREYLRFLVGVANEKMEANRKRTDAFLEALQSDSKYGCENAYSGEECLIDEVTCSKALDILKEYGATKLVDKVAEVRRTAKSPLQIMNETLGSLIKDKGLPAELLEELPTRWERLGDIVVLPVTSFKNPLWDSIGGRPLACYCQISECCSPCSSRSSC